MTFVVQQPSIIVVPSGPGQGGPGPPGPAGSGSTIVVENEGVVQGVPVDTLNFTGSAVSASVSGTEATVAISGGGQNIYEVHVFDFLTAGEQADVLAYGYANNLTDQLRAASAAITSLDGGKLILPAGGYLVVQQTLGGFLLDGVTPCAWGPEEIITIKDCTKPVVISGYGAVLKAVNGYRYGAFDPVTGAPHPSVVPFYDYDYYGYPYRGMIYVDNNALVLIEGFELDGNSPNMILGGEFGDSQWQIEGHGIAAANNDRLVIRDVWSHHQPCDSAILVNAGLTEASPPSPTLVENCVFTYPGRQGVSLTGGKQITFFNCDLSHAGAVVVGATPLQTSPGCGIDLEAENSIIRDVEFINCRFMNNWAQRSIGATTGNSARVRFRGCMIEDILLSRPSYHFMDTVILGRFSIALAFYNQYKIKSAEGATTITIAASGSAWTITRASGSFVTDGFAVGDKVTLNGAVNNINRYRPLLVTSITATVLTVVTLNGVAMVAEGPIASCTVHTAHIEEDGLTFDRVLFTRDPAYLQGGSVYASQSAWQEALYCKFTDCIIDTGAVDLPNVSPAYPAPIQQFAPVFENCLWRTTSTSTVTTAVCGYFRGTNRITTGPGGSVIMNFATPLSIVEYGSVYLNGVLQTAASNVSTQSGTSYTAALTDANGYIRFTNGSAITFTIPPNSTHPFAIGAVIEIEQAGAGALSVAAGSGVTVNSPGGDLTLAGLYSVAAVKKVAADTWTLVGDL